MATVNTLAINLHKRSASMPWVVVMEVPGGMTFEVSVGEDGNMAAGPRLQELLWAMDKKVLNFPTTYDMQHIADANKRTIQTRFMKDKPVYSDIDELFKRTALVEFQPIQLKPFEEQVNFLDSHEAFMNISATPAVAMANFSSGQNLIEEHPSNANAYWIVMDADSVTVTNGGQLTGMVEGFIWPNGETAPKRLGNTEITSNKTKVTVDYLGVEAFATNLVSVGQKPKYYGVEPNILVAAGKEALGYNKKLIESGNMLAISLQYDRRNNELVTSNKNNIIGSVYSTKYVNFQEVQHAVQAGHLKGISVNKSLLKEQYSGNSRLKSSVPHAVDVPLVEFTGFEGPVNHNGIWLTDWARQHNLVEPPNQKTYDELRKKREDAGKTAEESLNDMMENASQQIVKKGSKRSYDMPKDYAPNDLKFVPAKDDRLENGYLYRTITPEDAATGDALPYDYTHKVRIGDSIFEVPPLSIRTDKQFKNQKIQGMRSKTAMHSQVGHTRNVLTLELYFHDLENINGREVIMYEEQLNEKGQEVVMSTRQDEKPKEILPIENHLRLPANHKFEKVTVSRVIDGDTFTYEADGKSHTVRLTLVDTPEIGSSNKDAQPLSGEAKRYLEGLILGKTIYLEQDKTDRDTYDRKLRYAYLENGLSVQGELVANAYARVAPYPPNTKYLSVLRNLERQAQANEQNIWSYNDYVTGKGFNEKTATLKIKESGFEDVSIFKSIPKGEKLGKQIVYYMDGLRSLVAQFKKTPFLPIDNEYINEDLLVHNVALRDLQVQTVEGFPEALHATVTLEEVDVKPYLMGEPKLGDVINYPLMRWHYQQLLQEPSLNEPHKTFLPKIDRLTNQFTFSIVNRESLDNRTSAISRFRSMKIPSRYADDFYNPDATSDADVNTDSRNANSALKIYNNFLDAIKNGISDSVNGINLSSSDISNLKNEFGNYIIPADLSRDDFGFWRDLLTAGIKREDVFASIPLAVKMYGRSEKDFKKSNPINTSATFVVETTYNGVPSTFNNVLYQHPTVTDLSIVSPNNPGYFLIEISSDEVKKRVEDEIRSWGASPDEYITNGGTRRQKGLYRIPASDYQGRNSLSLVQKLANTQEEIDEDIDDYTFKYNALVAEINRSEGQMLMDEFLIPDLIPLNLTVGLHNNLSEVQVEEAETPSFQYFGASEPQVSLSFETDNHGIQRVEELFRTVASYAKTYRDGIVSGFMGINNPLVNLFGIDSVIPDTIQYSTIPNQPGRFIVNLTFLGFDKGQRRQEALYGFAGGNPNKRLEDMAYDNYDPRVDALYIEEKMRQMELYPDLEMPKVSELNEVLPYINSGLTEWDDNGSGQVYLDPDFYVSTEVTYRSYLKQFMDRKEDSLFEWQDGEGYTIGSNLEKNDFLIMEQEMKDRFVLDSKNTPYSDPETEWENYRDGHSESIEEDALEETEGLISDLGVTEIHTEPKNYPGGQIKNYLSGNYKRPPSYSTWATWTNGGSRAQYNKLIKGELNPSDTEIWLYLANEILAQFPDLNIPEKELNDITNKVALSSNVISDKKAVGLTGTNVMMLSDSGLATGPSTIHNDIVSNHLEIYLSGHFRDSVWAPNKEFFQENYRAESKIDLKGKTVLTNGLNEHLLSDRGIFKQLTGNWFGFDDKKMPFMRVLTQLKSIMRISSGWRQFADGEPFISLHNEQGLPVRVGMMGIDISKKSQGEIERLMWDWKYNIKKSIQQMVTVYKQAKASSFYEIEIRRLDWAIASHSGEQMPVILRSNDKKDDKPIPNGNTALAPESYRFYNQVYATWLSEAKQTTDANAPAIYSNGRGQIIPRIFAMYNAVTIEEGETAEDALNRTVAQENLRMHNNLDNWTVQEKVRGMFIDMYQHDQTGRLLRAFPSFSLQLIDEGKWYGAYRTWDNFYGYNALNSIDVYKSRKVAADTAIIEMSNIYGGLSGMKNSQVNHNLKMPSFFSSHFWEHYVLGTPTDEVIDERKEIYDSVLLETGARIHLRMGYGSDSRHLPIVFNGVITEMETGDIIQITAQGDGLELTNTISGDVDDKNKGLFFVKEPSSYIGELMTEKGNWLQEVINKGSGGLFFQKNPSGIAHFGSSVQAESGNYNPFSDDYGESMQNVYSQNGEMTKSQWKKPNGDDISFWEMYFKPMDDAIIGRDLTELGGDYDEDNIGVKVYGSSPWEIIQTFALCSSDYISAVIPFEMRSSLFFGKPHWPITYRYDSTYIYDEATGKMRRQVDYEHKKTFMQAHLYSSQYNIISNDIKTSAEGVFNNVVVNYDGRTVGPMQADSDIRYDRQTTAHVDANIIARTKFAGRNYFTSEAQAQKYGHSTVRDFMKDMYKGSYIVLGDATVKPYDLCYISDGLHDMQGIHLVKAVHHSMNAQHGFITTIEPDAFVVNFDAELTQVAANAFSAMKNTLIPAFGHGAALMSMVYLPSIVGKLAKGIATGALTKVRGVASNHPTITAMATTLAKGLGSRVQTSAYMMYAKSIGSEPLQAAVRNVKDAKTLAYKANTVETMVGLRKAETARILTDYDGASDALKIVKGYKADKGATAKGLRAIINGPDADINMGTAIRSMISDLDDVDAIYDSLVDATSIHGVVTGVNKTTTAATGIKGKLLSISAKGGGIALRIGWTLVVEAVLIIAVSGLREFWSRKKQDAQCVLVYPMTYKGGQMTAAMNGRRGAVYGDDPSLSDKLRYAQFGDGDNEVDAIWWDFIPKTLNLL